MKLEDTRGSARAFRRPDWHSGYRWLWSGDDDPVLCASWGEPGDVTTVDTVHVGDLCADDFEWCQPPEPKPGEVWETRFNGPVLIVTRQGAPMGGFSKHDGWVAVRLVGTPCVVRHSESQGSLSRYLAPDLKTWFTTQESDT